MKSRRPIIAIIDDDTWLVEEYVRTLEKSGYRTATASNAVEGIDLIDHVHPQVVILDLFMPGPNGIVLLHELRSHTDLMHIPIVLISNSAGDLDAAAVSAYGVSLVLDKTTMQPSDLVAAVKKVLP